MEDNVLPVGGVPLRSKKGWQPTQC